MLKKIRTREKIEKEKRRNQVIVGVILIGILVLSTAGFALLGGDGEDEKQGEKKEYNGFEFSRMNSLWRVELGPSEGSPAVEKQEFYFQYLPQEIENVSVSGFYNLQSYAGKPLYFVNDNPAASEILNNIGRYILRYQEACLEGINCSDIDRPDKTCADNLIVFEGQNESEKTSVYQNQSCVYISGDFMKGADAFLYRLLGVR